jgi:hypothetical protein
MTTWSYSAIGILLHVFDAAFDARRHQPVYVVRVIED